MKIVLLSFVDYPINFLYTFNIKGDWNSLLLESEYNQGAPTQGWRS